MTSHVKPVPRESSGHSPRNLEGQPLSAVGQHHTGGTRGADLDACDPENPDGKPQGTQQDQEAAMVAEGQPVELPADAGRLPATAEDTPRGEHEAPRGRRRARPAS